MPYDTNSVQIFGSVMRVALRRGIPTGKSPGFPFPAQNADHSSPQLEQSPSSGALPASCRPGPEGCGHGKTGRYPLVSESSASCRWSVHCAAAPGPPAPHLDNQGSRRSKWTPDAGSQPWVGSRRRHRRRMRAAKPMLTPKLTTPMRPLQKALSLVLNGLFTAFYSQCWSGRRWRHVRKEMADGAMQLVQRLVGMRLRLNAVSTANDQGLFEVGFTTA